MADQVRRIESRQLFLANREGDHRNVVGGDARRCQFLVEADIGIAIDGRDHADLLAIGAERHDIGDDRRPVRMAERRVVDEDVFLGDAIVFQILLENAVGRARIDIVRAQKRELLDAQLLKEIVGGRNRLLVGRSAGVEDVLRAFLTLILDRVEHQPVQLFEHRQRRLTADRCPRSEDHIDFLDGEQFAGLFGEQRPVGRRIDDDRFKLSAQKAAFFVLLVDKHLDGVFQRGLGDRHRSRQRMQDADLDRSVLGLGGTDQCGGCEKA